MGKYTNKNKKNIHKTTLDQKHQKFIKDNDEKNSHLMEKKNQMKYFIDELLRLNEINLKRSKLETMTKIAEIKMEIKKLEKEIKEIESGDSVYNYVVKNYSILKPYYDMKKKGMLYSNKNMEIKSGSDVYKSRGLLSYFKKPTENTNEKTMDISDFNEKYMSINDIDYVKKTKTYTSVCPNCKKELTVSYRDGSLYCACGYMDNTLVSIEKINYKEPSQEKNISNAYRRINHLTEIMSQFQANESTEIPEQVFIDVRKEYRKRKINKYQLDIFLLRKLLKKLRYSKYYEHTPHILQIINGKVPPKFTKYHENKIKQMFRDIQKPFELFKPASRKNFLSYAYVLHKFCELLELDQYLDYFPLLKNINKLKQHDKMWKSICGYMKWKYYSST